MGKKDELANVSTEPNEMTEVADQQSLEAAENSPQRAVQYRMTPDHYLNYSNGEWRIEVHLPGVSKEQISLRILPDLFDLQAKRAENMSYTLTEYFPFEIRTDTVQANYNNGLLLIKGSIKNPLDEAVDIAIN